MRIAITGGSGLLALNWAVAMRDSHEICLLTHNRSVALSGVQTSHVALDSSEDIDEFLQEWRPDILVNTVGMTNVDQCEEDPVAALHTNATIAGNVASAAHGSGISFVHISTDHLFSGKTPMVDEAVDPDPLNVYAHTKLEGERNVLLRCPGAMVVRTNFYGWGHRFRTSFSDWVIGALRRGESINAFSDVWFTPILIDHLVGAIHELIVLGATGIINIVDGKRVSKYDFAMKLADSFGLDTRLVIESSSRSVQAAASRPSDLSLSNHKVISLLGHPPGSLEEGMRELWEQEQSGRHAELLDAVSN